MREGFTTGSCAAAAALASCLWQAQGECPLGVEIEVPAGKTYAPRIIPVSPFRCGVQKDAGDDPDITNGRLVWAEVALGEGDGAVSFRAGEGVGTVSLPGLKLPVGEAAINPVPREMIEKAVRSVYPGRALTVTVGIEGGRELAEKTFNPRLGVVGGLSVLGTSGVVRPMSEEAITESITLDLSVKRAQGADQVALVFGHQGETVMNRLSPLPTVQMSNFVGFTLLKAEELGFRGIVIGGHPGKLVKVAAGVMQTHSSYADARREPIAAHLALMGADRALIEQVMRAITTEQAIRLIREANCGGVWNRLAEAARGYVRLKAKAVERTDVVFWDNDGVILGQSEGAGF